MNKDNINNNSEETEDTVSRSAAEAEEGVEAAADELTNNSAQSDDGDDFADASENPSQGEDTKANEENEEGPAIDLPLDLENEESPSLSRRAVRRNENKERINITKTKPFKICAIVIAALFVVAAATYTACIMYLPTNTVMKNVVVEGVDVGGLSYSEVLKKIEEIQLADNKKITLTCNGKSFDISGEDVELTASPRETAKLAYKYGKSGNKFIDGFAAFRLLFSKRSIIPSASFDEAKMRDKINEFGNQVYGERKNHYIEIADGKAIVWPGVTGYDGNSDNALEKITEALKSENYDNISVSFASSAPDELTLEAFDNEVYSDPVDAHFERVDNEVKVVNEANGRYINKEEAASLIPNVKEGGGPIEIPYYYSYPTVFASDLNGKLFADTMATYSTSFASSGSNRASNVARAASLINGKVLMPEEVFSFNDAVGRRTVENGFKTAPEYVDGKTVDGIGGGTCQVSSTLYNAVLYADLAIVTRTNHMFAVGYTPNGQDATVADSGVDFKFKNNSPYPVKISAYTSGGQITVSIIGTNYEPKHEVKISNSTSFSNNGDTHVRTTRTVYANGKVIKSEALPSSLYRKHVEEEEASQTTENSASPVSAPVTYTAPEEEPASSNEDAPPESEPDTSETSASDDISVSEEE